MSIAVLTRTLVCSKAHLLVFPVKYSVESKHHITAYNSPCSEIGFQHIVLLGVKLPYTLSPLSLGLIPKVKKSHGEQEMLVDAISAAVPEICLRYVCM